MKYGHIDGNGLAEIRNFNIQNLASAPTTGLKKGRFYYNTTDDIVYVYDGTQWVNALSQGNYTFTNGVQENDRQVTLKLNTTGSSGLSTLSADSNGLKINVTEASTDAKGIIEIATDTEASTGTSEVLAINPKQLATKVTANTAITGATHTKITYDSKGLVTSGADLSASDIPNLTLSKITDVTATAAEVNVLDGITASTAELNILDGVTATASEINVLDGITASTTELNYVDGVTSSIQTQFSNKLDKKPDGTNDLIDSGNKVSATYLPDYILGQMLYAGTFAPSTATATLSTNAKTKLGTSSDTIVLTNDTTPVTGYSANEGNYYLCSGNGTFASISLLVGDWLVSTGSGWNKVDNTDAVTGVKGNAESSYRTGNINITADNVLPTQTNNSGKFLTTNGTTASWAEVDGFPTQTGNAGKFLTTDGTDTSWATALTPSGTQTVTNKTIDADDNTISDLTASNLKSGVLLTSIRASSSASDTSWVSEKGVATALESKVYTAQNTALTVSGGICTWTVTHNMNNSNVGIHLYEVSSGDEVMFDRSVTSANVVTIKILSASNISANTYKVVILG